ncbi:MAG: polysaccharide deacetylase family protein [Oscillospiraceae bacterium]|nr:polysaccharide deacetylase family protein [Oscillospiraceae bacterium]
MKRIFSFLLAACLPPVLAGCTVAEPDLTGYASGPAEIPVEILGELDTDTRQALTGDRKYIALTFDDGPRADTTGRLLEGLAQRNAACTFFIIGEQVRGNEYLLCRMASDGHQIGSHTYSHTRLTTVSKENMVEEIHKTEVVLKEVAGDKTFWLRPPYGQIDSTRAQEIKTPMIYWSVDPQDWKLLNTEKVVDAVVSTVQPGDIILLHDFYSTSVDAALQIIDQLQPQGFVFVTVEELFRIQGVEPQPGVLYANPSKIRPIP